MGKYSKEQAAPASIISLDDYAERAQLLEQQGNLEGAKQCFNSAILQAPRSAKAWGGRGDINKQQGNYDDALRDYQQVLHRLFIFKLVFLMRVYRC